MAPQDAPKFFIPGQSSVEDGENDYRSFAQTARQGVPELGKRVYSITFNHDEEQWTATVGQQMTGTATKVKKVAGKRVETKTPLGNRSVVLAIFPGNPFVVWHDGTSRTWENPFYAGRPFAVTLFSV